MKHYLNACSACRLNSVTEDEESKLSGLGKIITRKIKLIKDKTTLFDDVKIKMN